MLFWCWTYSVGNEVDAIAVLILRIMLVWMLTIICNTVDNSVDASVDDSADNTFRTCVDESVILLRIVTVSILILIY
jgi:hypothetical protein